ncbi:uncharacterized protein BO87DRAFT_415098 [Aspergillus neoniger CBS 115656]|uniref:Rhodopsin domain-containing protein n=1 Tax=Aspergillus neoniger (strain CBS 115656) TaxID=1448310 RepID=A0A318YMH7_ASPNB|nr:hypothetical protein BO87DRAFT_415098 [Aspergillus neoniger CBS 115656]PYH35434.1 hypothetical protein BO87DRAFT_415098 [Aspergillus neoniger CBS 115656]
MTGTDGSAMHLPDPVPPMVYTVRGVIGAFSLLTLIVCCLRLYLRGFIMHALGLDDCLVLLALSMVLVFAALSIILTTYGIGYHQDTVPTADMIMTEKYVYILFCLYIWVALAVKCSLTVFIMRVFPTKWIRRIGLGIMVLMVIVTISGELPLIFQCWPVQAAWDSTIPNSKCFSNAVLEDLQLYQAILMLLFDVSIITLPMPTIWKLQMPIQRRLFIIGLFCLGFVACSAGLARIPLLDFQVNSTDYTYVGAVPLILMNVEYALGLITGSLPSLRVLLRNIPGLNSSKKSTDPSRDWRNGPGHSGYQLSERSHWALKFKGQGRLDLESCDNESQQQIVVTTTVEQRVRADANATSMTRSTASKT